MSGFVELVECDAAPAEVYSSLVDWFKRFGVVHTWISDRGAHFKNAVISRLQKLLGVHHHFVTAYCPWANGFVEVVNRLILRCLKAHSSELKLSLSEWPTLLPLVQSSLNNMPADRLDGVAPITAFTALPASTPLHALFGPDVADPSSDGAVLAAQIAHLVEVRAGLDVMHQAVVASSDKRHAQHQARHAQRQGVKMPHFEIGDFALAANVAPRETKLALQWHGPKRIVQAENDYTFQVQDLVPPFGVTTHHASRLKFYADAGRGVTEDLIAHVHHGEG